MKKFIAMTLAVIALAVACSTQSKVQRTEREAPLLADNGLQSTTAFAAITDDEARARALFSEMGKVILHPRCSNCHPAGDQPMQGNGQLPHQPLVVRGEDGFGAPGMRCTTCHGESNFQNVPGNALWHLAPISMAWEGKSLGEICAQVKDPERNGGHDLAGLVEHMANDGLVGYAWDPPAHLEPAPGNQALLGQLTQAWVDAGAHCP